ncbi:MAG TPA: carboxypeptidase-like regulatory domain-containing protein, partial [Micromonosporaceae bacterium]
PLVFKPGRASFVLPVPKAGTARAVIDLPGEQADVHLSVGLVTGRTVADGRTIVEATLDPGSSTEVWWSMRDTAPVAATRELRTVADVMTLITIGDSDVRMATLVDVGVVQGELRTLNIQLPVGYEVTGVSGSSVDTSEQRDGGLVLTLGDPAARSHQFLIALERPVDVGSFSIDTAFVGVRDVQRERGEVAVEGVGTLELSAAEREGMHRVDVRELNASLQALSRLPLLSAFRYQRSAGSVPALALDVKRFPDAGVLAAVADRAEATTLVTGEGRALTEVRLHVQNRAQPFLKVTLPTGATMVSVDVAGETAKPVLGTDGIRVPLLRPGLRPTGTYQVSFVYVHAGTPFGKKGERQMTLPRMDMPVGIVQWEVFVPERYSVRTIDGNALDVSKIGEGVAGYRTYAPSTPAAVSARTIPIADADPTGVTMGLVRGHVADTTGAALPGVSIELTSPSFIEKARAGYTDSKGNFVFLGIVPGDIRLTAFLSGFASMSKSFSFDGTVHQEELTLRVGSVSETVTVTGEAPIVNVTSSTRSITLDGADRDLGYRVDREPQTVPPSQNVINLQRRTSGVLPIRVDVPRAGTSHQYVKPLVIDQETSVTLRYKRR